MRFLYSTRPKPAASSIAANRAWLGKRRIELDQVAIGLGVAGDDPAERRDDVEGVEVVEAIEGGDIDGREFETEEAAARFQDAPGLGERLIDPRHVPDAEGDGRGVKAARRERQGFGIRLAEGDPVAAPPPRGALASDGEHLRVDVGNGDLGILGAGDDPEGDVAGAAGDVEDAIAARRPPRRRQPRDQRVLPQPVHAARHQVVHQVVAAGDALEDAVDESLLLVEADLAEAEAGAAAALVIPRGRGASWHAVSPNRRGR